VVFPNYFSMEVNARYFVEERDKEIERLRAYREQQLFRKSDRPSLVSAALAVVRGALSRIFAGLSRTGTADRTLTQTPATGAGQ
jgi:hypothetical protein